MGEHDPGHTIAGIGTLTHMTLLPGDIVQTGVPAPVVPLPAGDSVEITTERLGTLRNRGVAKAAPGTF